MTHLTTSVRRFSGLACGLFLAGQAYGTILSNPVITNQATPFSGTFVGGNVFDQGSPEYASQGQGASTFLEFDFGSPQSINGFVNVTRNNTADNIGNSRLIFDTDGVAGFNPLTDTIMNFTQANTGNNGQGYINRFAPTTARFARWEVLTSLGPSQNLGSMEMAFMGSTSPVVTGVTVINAAANPFGANYVMANAANGVAGRGTGLGVEYASNAGGGQDLFVDFDMGAITPLTGFDFFDRIAAVDHIGTFNIIFSNDPTFTTNILTQNYNKGATGAGPWTFSANFAPVSARYVRFDSTSSAAPGGNLGIGDMVFYTVPEPGSMAMLGAAGVLLLGRRRRA